MEFFLYIFDGYKWKEITSENQPNDYYKGIPSSSDITSESRIIFEQKCYEIYCLIKKMKFAENCIGKLNILFWSDLNLRDEIVFKKFAEQFFIEKIELLKSNKDQLETHKLNPVLNIGTVDFYDTFLELALSNVTTTPREEIYKRSIENESHVDDYVKYYRFLDSCIWTRYLWAGSNNFSTSLQLLVNNYFCFNYKLSLYNTSVAYEYIDLQSRLMLESRINDLGNSNGHSKAIVPFGFQSETELICHTSIEGRKLKELLGEIKNIPEEEKIRVFLWDDRANEKLSSINGPTQDIPTKGEILRDLLINFLHHSEEKQKISLNNFISTHLFNSENDYSDSTFDLILCDFLLVNNEKKSFLSTEYILHYLTKTLQRKDDFMSNSKIGDKLWLFPVSSFNLAMSEKFAQLGFEYFSKKWVMSDGADFINTPNAFRYKFTEFLLQLIEESGVNLFEDNKHSLLEYFISVIKQDNKQAYIEAYPKMINIHQKFLKLSEDLKIKKGGFTKWVINRVYNGVSDIFMEHLIHLMHFLAFSSKVQKHQMLEEVHFLYERWPDESSKETFFTQLNTYIMKW